MNRLILILLIFMGSPVWAQEFFCKTNVIADQIQGVDAKIFNTMETAIDEFVNTRKWSTDNFDTKEKIECVISIVLSKRIEDVEGGYIGRISVQSKRPVYNSSFTSTMVNFQDKDFQIKYIQFQPIQFNDNRVSGAEPLESNLSAVIAYYCYLMLGLDYDSFAPKGGTDFFNKALNIANNAPEHKNIDGWKATDKEQRNRYWLIDQILNTRFGGMRDIMYKYHRLGLDMMTEDEEMAKVNINTVFPMLQIVNQDNPSSYWVQFFIRAKSEEFISYLSSLPVTERQKFIPVLTQIDVSNASKYIALMK